MSFTTEELIFKISWPASKEYLVVERSEVTTTEIGEIAPLSTLDIVESAYADGIALCHSYIYDTLLNQIKGCNYEKVICSILHAPAADDWGHRFLCLQILNLAFRLSVYYTIDCNLLNIRFSNESLLMTTHGDKCHIKARAYVFSSDRMKLSNHLGIFIFWLAISVWYNRTRVKRTSGVGKGECAITCRFQDDIAQTCSRSRTHSQPV